MRTGVLKFDVSDCFVLNLMVNGIGSELLVRHGGIHVDSQKDQLGVP